MRNTETALGQISKNSKNNDVYIRLVNIYATLLRYVVILKNAMKNILNKDERPLQK